MVANGVREQLGRLLATEIDLDLIEPVVPGPDQRSVLFGGALAYRVRGRLCDVFIVVRRADALALAGAAFRESARGNDHPLSSIERQTIDRIASALAAQCAALCGQSGAVVREDAGRVQSECSTYFEVRTTAPPRIAIGFALSRDPEETVGERIGVERLMPVPIEARAEIGRGSIGIDSFASLRVGSTIALGTMLGAPGTLRVGGRSVALGACGHSGGRAAFAVQSAGGAR